MNICRGGIQPVTRVPSSAPIYANPHWILIICMSLCLVQPLRFTEQVSIHPDSPTVLRIAECPSGSQLPPHLHSAYCPQTHLSFMGGEIEKEPAGLSPASLCNLGYVGTLLEPLGAQKDKPHLTRAWEEQSI